jgi:hypothetical protein
MPGPKAPGEPVRDQQVKAYLSQDEKNAVERAAWKQGKGVSEWLRDVMRKELGLR